VASIVRAMNSWHKLRQRPQHGFTLLELLTTVAVAGVLMAVAVPNMRDFLRNGRLTSAANDLLRSTQTARSEAVKRQQTIAVCATSNPAASAPVCSYSNFRGWIVFVDTNGDWQANSTEAVLERHDLLDSSVTIKNDNDGIVSYSPSGFANPAGTKTPARNVVICDVRGNQSVGLASAARTLLIDATGRARVGKSTSDVATAIALTGSCP
jgi:type IV fimbrial biogenesis protein FimT